MRYHTVTFDTPEAANAFAQKAMIRWLVTTSVQDLTVYMVSRGQLDPRHTTWIQAEAATFGHAVEWKFNKTVDEQATKECVKYIFSEEIDADIARDKGDDFGAGFHLRQAEEMSNDLEDIGVTLDQDPEDGEIWHVLKDGQPWLDFHTAEWSWRNAGGLWPWQETNLQES